MATLFRLGYRTLDLDERAPRKLIFAEGEEWMTRNDYVPIEGWWYGCLTKTFSL